MHNISLAINVSVSEGVQNFRQNITNMSVIVTPIKQCIAHFEYEENVPVGCENSIKWLGFDKYKNLVFGYRKCRENIEEREIVMLSIYGKTVKVIKKFQILFSSNVTYFDEPWAISENGTYIVGGHAHYEEDKNVISTLLYSFSVETGLMETFRFTFDFKNDLFTMKNFKIYHTVALGWVCVVSFYATSVKQSCFVMYSVSFNVDDKTCSLGYLTEWESDLSHCSWPVMCGSTALFLSQVSNSLKIFDCDSKLWVSKILPLRSNVSHVSYHVIPSSEIEHPLIAIPQRFSIPRYKGIELYKLVDENWEEMNVSLRLKHHYACGSVEDIFCSSNTIFAKIVEEVYHPQGIDDTKYFVLCINIGVISLKSLSMKCIFENCGKLKGDVILKAIDLPRTLKRQYFGPGWTL